MEGISSFEASLRLESLFLVLGGRVVELALDEEARRAVAGSGVNGDSGGSVESLGLVDFLSLRVLDSRREPCIGAEPLR